jgi:hypothetical protein
VNLCGIYGGRLFISDTNWNDIQIYDIGNPLSPQFISRYDWNLPTYGLHASGNTLYTINGYYGLNIHDLTEVGADDPGLVPAATLQAVNFPNPFNPEACIEFSLPDPGRISLRVYNLKGQLVRELNSDLYPQGKHRVVWDGRDDEGKAVSSGVYLFRLESGKAAIVRKMLLAK